MRSRPPLGSLREEESRPVPLGARSSPWPERRGRRFPGTHLEPVVNISPGFPSTNSSARALPSPPPTSLAAEGPPSPQLPLLPPPAGPPARHSPTRPGCQGGGAEGGEKEKAARPITQSERPPVAGPRSGFRLSFWLRSDT